MNETRRKRIAAAIQQELSQMIREVKDPRVQPVTLTHVEVTADASQATVFVALFAGGVESGERRQSALRECLTGLASASGYLRRQLGQVLTVRHVPALIFREDRGIENVSRVHELLKQAASGSGEAR